MEQGSLFDIPAGNADMAVGLAGLITNIKAALNKVAGDDEAGRALLLDKVIAVAQRERVAMTNGGGKTVKIDVFNKWLQPKDKEHDPTLVAILCVCLAAGDASPLKPILDVAGLVAIPKEDLKYLRVGNRSHKKGGGRC